ncbi:MAG TPA: hypothetical protein VGQ57_21190, partial [Polyangiaceae bacterium]|nr:hypothetical protein [Polyangiaceae bacterium]
MGSVVAQELGIRRFSAADGPFVGALSLEAFGPFAGNARETTLRMVGEPSTRTLVATRDDERLGFVVIELHGRGIASVQAIAVA